MNILDILTKGAGVPAGKIRELILAGAKAVPELADEAQLIVAAMDSALSTDELLELGGTIIAEARGIAAGKIDPRDHPSDL